MKGSNQTPSLILPTVADANVTTNIVHLSPTISTVFHVIDFSLFPPIIYLHYLIILMLRRDKKKKGNILIKSVLQVYCLIVPVSSVAMYVYTDVLLMFIDIPFNVLGKWFCNMIQLVTYFGGIYVGSFSLTAALMKYWFIVKSVKAKKFGEKKATVLFLVLHLAFSITTSVLNMISTGNEDMMYWINRCWNKEMSNDLFCLSHEYDTIKYFGEEIANNLKAILRSICGCLTIINFVVFGNIAELILYTTIWRNINR